LRVLAELCPPPPAARLDSPLSLGGGDSVDAVRLFYVGSYAASRGRGRVLRGSLERLQSRAQRLRATGDSSEAGFTEAVRHALEGYARWQRGQRDDGLRLLQGAQPRVVGDWRRGRVNVRL